jgi:MATE family multidrug resistance protein
MGIGEVIYLSIPTVVGLISFTIMQFVDGVMVARVSEDALAAQLTAQMGAFVPIAFMLGFLGAVSTFASQCLGAKMPERAALYGWQGLWLSIVVSVAMGLLVLLAGPIFSIFGHTGAIHDLEVPYYQIMTGGAFFIIAFQALTNFFIGMHRPMVAFVGGVVGNLVNFVVAYALIFGMWGMPKMGLNGAAIGMVVGGLVMFAIGFTYFLAGPLSRTCGVFSQCRVSWPAMRELIKLGFPAGAMFLGDVLMWTLFWGWVIGSFGDQALAAANILNRYWQICFMPALGVSAAAAAIVGRYVGAGQPRLAWRRAHAALALVEVYMIGTGIFMWIFRDRLVAFFNESGQPPVHDPVVQAMATQTFIFVLICQAFDALNVIFIGALRGAGDTLWPGIVQLCLAYGLGLGGSALVARLAPGWGVFGPWSTGSLYIILLGLLMWGRFLSGRWKSLGVISMDESAGGR